MNGSFKYGFEKDASLAQLGSVVKSTWSAAKPVLQKGMQSMAAVAKQTWNAAKPIAQNAYNQIKPLAQQGMKTVGDKFNSFKQGFNK